MMENKNMTINVKGCCFWCGEENGELLTLETKDEQTSQPEFVITNYQPCGECADRWSQAIVMVEVNEKQEHPDMPPIYHDENSVPYYPTGRYILTTDGGLDIILKDGKLKDDIKRTRKTYISSKLYEYIKPLKPTTTTEHEDTHEDENS